MHRDGTSLLANTNACRPLTETLPHAIAGLHHLKTHQPDSMRPKTCSNTRKHSTCTTRNEDHTVQLPRQRHQPARAPAHAAQRPSSQHRQHVIAVVGHQVPLQPVHAQESLTMVQRNMLTQKEHSACLSDHSTTNRGRQHGRNSSQYQRRAVTPSVSRSHLPGWRQQANHTTK